ncbi:hypothetical protein K440DRAFT_670367 [Wilcoxina mikolae CBS 423.85]|nr:hypothetical protein K440DRAFT_670367 [Wilcoxina mikolae CBS 423.85]
MPPSPQKRSFRRRRNSFSISMFSRKPRKPPPKISGPIHLAQNQPDTSAVLQPSPSFPSIQPNTSFASIQPSTSSHSTAFDPHPGQRVAFLEDLEHPHPSLKLSVSIASLASNFDPHPGQRVVVPDDIERGRSLHGSPSVTFQPSRPLHSSSSITLQPSVSVSSLSSVDRVPPSPSFHSGARKFFYGSGATELPELEFSGSPLWPNTPAGSSGFPSPTKPFQDSPTRKLLPRDAGAAPPMRRGRSGNVTPEEEDVGATPQRLVRRSRSAAPVVERKVMGPPPRLVRSRSVTPKKMDVAIPPPLRSVRSRSFSPEKEDFGRPLPPRPARSSSISPEKMRYIVAAPPPRPPPAPPLGLSREMVPVQGGMLLAAARDAAEEKDSHSFGIMKLFARTPVETSQVRRIRHLGLKEEEGRHDIGVKGGNVDNQGTDDASQITASNIPRLGSKVFTGNSVQHPGSKVLAGESVPHTGSKITKDSNPKVDITIATPKTTSVVDLRCWTPVVDADMLRRAKQLGIDIDSSPSASPPSVRSIRAAVLPERGIPPLYWREMLHNGIWARILQYTSNSDVCTLSRVCQYAQYIAESHLYHTLTFSPLYPHNVSYSHLIRHITTLIKNHANNAKFTLYTRRIVIPPGWVENAITVIDPLKPNYKITTRQSDGGVRELNLVLQGLVRLTRNLESLQWDSPIPINTFLTASKLATLTHLTTLHLNLSQPPIDSPKHSGTQYTPAISRWGALPLKDLRLHGLEEVNGQVHSLITAVAKSLQSLTLEISSEIHQELILPPLTLHELTLRGFTLTTLPSTLHSLTLQSCTGDPTFSPVNITTFSTDCASFLHIAVDIAAHGGKKEISFFPSDPVDITPLLSNTLRLRRLILSASCILPAPALHKFLLSGCSLVELEIPVSKDQWSVFLRDIGMLRWVKKVGVWIDGLEGREKGRRAEEIVGAGETAGIEVLEVRVNGVGWRINGREMVRIGQTPEKMLRVGGGVKAAYVPASVFVASATLKFVGVISKNHTKTPEALFLDRLVKYGKDNLTPTAGDVVLLRVKVEVNPSCKA